MYQKKNCFLVLDTTPGSDNPLRFRKNLIGRIQKLLITIN